MRGSRSPFPGPESTAGFVLRLALFLTAFLVLLIGLGWVGTQLGWDRSGVPLDRLPVTGAAVGAGLLLLALDRRRPAAFGLSVSRAFGVEIGFGFLGGVLTMAVVAGLLAAFGAMGLGGVRWVADVGVVSWLSAATSALWLLAVPALAEEVLLRGYLFQLCAIRFGIGSAVIVTSVTFGVLHAGNPALSATAWVNLGMAGVVLAVLVARTGSLWAATAAHLGWNWAVGFGADLPVSGLEWIDNPAWTGVPSGVDWISGGAFGPEASVVTTAVLTVVAIGLWRTDRLHMSAVVERADGFLAQLKGRDSGGFERFHRKEIEAE